MKNLPLTSLDNSIQINDGLTQTSADGVSMAFDKKYGIMFCVYMPGPIGAYGESRGRISLTYFPAAQPTNSKTVEVSSGNTEYVPNIISLGEGKVRVFYEKNSRDDGDHLTVYKDYDFLTETFTDENVMMLKKEDGSIVPLTESEQFAYLEKNGYFNHTYLYAEQITSSGCTMFQGEDGYWYGAVSTYLSEPVLYRSKDNMATVEFFAIFPKTAQYEFDYKFLNGKIYTIYRTAEETNAIYFSSSCDMGKTWAEPIAFENSIQCRPKIIVYNNHILMGYNYYNSDTQNRPEIQQGRTSVRICYGEKDNPNDNIVVADLYSRYGIVNIFLIDILNDLYMAYSSSPLALEYQNGNPMVRGKDSIRYLKLGDVIPE